MTGLRAADIKVCLATGFAPVTRDALPWMRSAGGRGSTSRCRRRTAGWGRPWPRSALTALLRLGGGAVKSSRLAIDDSPATSSPACGPGPASSLAWDNRSLRQQGKPSVAAGAPHVLDLDRRADPADRHRRPAVASSTSRPRTHPGRVLREHGLVIRLPTHHAGRRRRAGGARPGRAGSSWRRGSATRRGLLHRGWPARRHRDCPGTAQNLGTHCRP